MSSTFICSHCRKRLAKNYRIKSGQRYCGSKACQQARKNKWERERLRKDKTYKEKRRSSKKRWYSEYPGDRYQHTYRETHVAYREKERERQNQRNGQRKNGPSSKIVKTDALTSASIDTQGIYVLLPYKHVEKEKIVKTDALIVQMVSTTGLYGKKYENSS